MEFELREMDVRQLGSKGIEKLISNDINMEDYMRSSFIDKFKSVARSNNFDTHVSAEEIEYYSKRLGLSFDRIRIEQDLRKLSTAIAQDKGNTIANEFLVDFGRTTATMGAIEHAVKNDPMLHLIVGSGDEIKINEKSIYEGTQSLEKAFTTNRAGASIERTWTEAIGLEAGDFALSAFATAGTYGLAAKGAQYGAKAIGLGTKTLTAINIGRSVFSPGETLALKLLGETAPKTALVLGAGGEFLAGTSASIIAGPEAGAMYNILSLATGGAPGVGKVRANQIKISQVGDQIFAHVDEGIEDFAKHFNKKIGETIDLPNGQKIIISNPPEGAQTYLLSDLINANSNVIRETQQSLLDTSMNSKVSVSIIRDNYFPLNKFEEFHPRPNFDIYHNLEHTETVSELANSFAVARGLSPEEAKFIGEVALLHDLDPLRTLGTAARVPETLRLLKQDFNEEISLTGETGRSILKDKFGWTEKDLLKAEAMIQRTEFPFTTNPNPYYKDLSPVERYKIALEKLSQQDREFVLREAAILSEYADKSSYYMTKNFDDSYRVVNGLANEINTNAGNKITDVSKLNTHQFLSKIGTEENFLVDRKIAEELGLEFNPLTKDLAFDYLPLKYAENFEGNIRGFTRFDDIISKGGTLESALENGRLAFDGVRDVPLGFASQESFNQYKTLIQSAIKDAENKLNVGNIKLALHGSSITGVSSKTGLEIDKPHDFDFIIINDKLFDIAMSRAEGLANQGNLLKRQTIEQQLSYVNRFRDRGEALLYDPRLLPELPKNLFNQQGREQGIETSLMIARESSPIGKKSVVIVLKD
ncbi:MAG: hypothetical protein AABW90_00200 [Nanoarchaeota archaeon]